MTPLGINLNRLRDTMLTLGHIGGDGRCINRVGFSAADMQARHWLIDQFRAAGLETNMDAVANVCGRWNVGQGAAIMLGSHTDSVPDGGLFDGSLGVLAGLECIRTLQDHGITLPCPIEVVSTSEEEGRFGGMLGAQALAGQIDTEWLNSACDTDGVLLSEALQVHGFDPGRVGEARRDPQSLKAFLELHIEQGPVLETRGIPVGIVEGISGVFNWTITFTGEANHSGTTPMTLRRDAFAGMAAFAHSIPQIIADAGSEQSRLTIGKVELHPNFPHTIPGQARFSLIGRDTELSVMQALAAACQASLAAAATQHGLTWGYQQHSWLNPAPCDPEIITALTACAAELNLDVLHMPSGAGHDTQFLSTLTRAGLIFVPSRGGISHAPEEWTDWEAIEQGSNVLLNTVMKLA